MEKKDDEKEEEDYPLFSLKTITADRPVIGNLEEETEDSVSVNIVTADRPVVVDVDLDGRPYPMELDTGAAFSLISEETDKELWPDCQLSATHVRLKTYSGEAIPVLGSREVEVKYKDQVARLPLIIVKGVGTSLLGRNWLQTLRLDWHEIKVAECDQLQAILERHSEVFEGGLGTMKGFKAKIFVDPDATPRFSKARSVPYAFRDKVEAELDRLVNVGILEPVEHADWASPIVSVLKADKESVRICGDFKQTINPVSKLDRYPIPKVEDLFAKLSGGKTFTKLDLSQAYQQLLLDDDSKKYAVINTHKGLYQYTRLPYGVSSAPGIFQRTMENLLKGIPGVVVYLDDILITGPTPEAHLRALDEVLRRLAKAGLRANQGKCRFLAPAVDYLGHRIDNQGLHPIVEKVEAIRDAPAPTNVSELRSYLGLLTYYSKFLPNMSTVLAPVYKLLRKDVKWSWKEEQRKAFDTSKKLLMSFDLLVHFDPKLDIVLACDASSYGVGAVLAHRMPDGSERPVGYASRTLSPAEKNYSQLEREGLACVFGIKRFHAYLFGHSFELVTDHKPLLALLNQHKSTSEQASARIRRWSLFMATYEYTIRFRKTEEHGNADALSRLPLPVTPSDVPTPAELVLLMEHLDDSPVTAQHVRTWTRKDPVLSTVLQYVLYGWPDKCDETLAPYSSRKNELSVHMGCVLWGSRVVLPPKARRSVLTELHEGHPGMTRMKSLARMYVWWPGLEKDIENTVSSCTDCQMFQSAPPVAPLQPWKWPTRPWARIHVDFAGPLFGKMFLVVIDAHSKWIEVFPTASSTSAVVVEHLRTLFAQFGVPETVVSDNGSCFVSEEFSTFLLGNGVKHITSAPYHPATNSLAERAVQIVKKGLKKCTEGTLACRVARVLFAYRTTPQSTTGVSPAELLLGRQPRTKLDLLRPNTAERVESKQLQQKANHDNASRDRGFTSGALVYAKNFGQGQRWWPGKVVEVTGPVSYRVSLESGHVIRRHQDHLRIRRNAPAVEPEAVLEEDVEQDMEQDLDPVVPDVPLPVAIQPSDQPSDQPSAQQRDQPSGATPLTEPVEVRVEETPVTERPGASSSTPIPASARSPARKEYPKRNHQQPNWLDRKRTLHPYM